MHILTEIAVLFNLIVFILYWTIIHAVAYEKYKENAVQLLHMYLVHTFPALSMTMILATMDVQL